MIRSKGTCATAESSCNDGVSEYRDELGRVDRVGRGIQPGHEEVFYMSLQDYITLGRSGLRVSPLSLGTMTFGTEWGWGSEEAQSREIFDRYVDQGGNFVDTANMYTRRQKRTDGRKVH